MLAETYRSPFASMFLARETNEKQRVMAVRVYASLFVCVLRSCRESIIRTLLPSSNDEENPEKSSQKTSCLRRLFDIASRIFCSRLPSRSQKSYHNFAEESKNLTRYKCENNFVWTIRIIM